MKKVFVADDNFDCLVLFNSWFKTKGFYIRTFSNSKYLFDAIEELLPDMIVIGERLHNEDGEIICNQIKNQYDEKVFVVMLSDNPSNLKKGRNNLADGIIQKPVEAYQIGSLISLYTEAQLS